jgi:hypothetical protein
VNKSISIELDLNASASFKSNCPRTLWPNVTWRTEFRRTVIAPQKLQFCLEYYFENNSRAKKAQTNFKGTGQKLKLLKGITIKDQKAKWNNLSWLKLARTFHLSLTV